MEYFTLLCPFLETHPLVPSLYEGGDNSLQDNVASSLEKRGGRGVSLMKAWEKTYNNGFFTTPPSASRITPAPG